MSFCQKSYLKHIMALMRASEIGYHKILKLLLGVHGININAKDNGKKTALAWDTNNGYNEIV